MELTVRFACYVEGILKGHRTSGAYRVDQDLNVRLAMCGKAAVGRRIMPLALARTLKPEAVFREILGFASGMMRYPSAVRAQFRNIHRDTAPVLEQAIRARAAGLGVCEGWLVERRVQREAAPAHAGDGIVEALDIFERHTRETLSGQGPVGNPTMLSRRIRAWAEQGMPGNHLALARELRGAMLLMRFVRSPADSPAYNKALVSLAEIGDMQIRPPAPILEPVKQAVMPTLPRPAQRFKRRELAFGRRSGSV